MDIAQITRERRLLRKVSRLEAEIARRRRELARLEDIFRIHGIQYEGLAMTRRDLQDALRQYQSALSECLEMGI